ncbi:hypothetical protein JI739_01365 [Ramlibacter sp. AW1]|uniref:WH2 domain-containing protein n=1 Tax=Ramlibacter aurantiacus TaxID=2801330 RepID=A0A936ZKJ2_9BURK|nr:hypothetical protein [Ramlibacter aurantiacus]MBL0418983.1 hypothetical protein [Ramlibacter aurantiacus]
MPNISTSLSSFGSMFRVGSGSSPAKPATASKPQPPSASAHPPEKGGPYTPIEGRRASVLGPEAAQSGAIRVVEDLLQPHQVIEEIDIRAEGSQSRSEAAFAAGLALGEANDGGISAGRMKGALMALRDADLPNEEMVQVLSGLIHAQGGPDMSPSEKAKLALLIESVWTEKTPDALARATQAFDVSTQTSGVTDKDNLQTMFAKPVAEGAPAVADQGAALPAVGGRSREDVNAAKFGSADLLLPENARRLESDEGITVDGKRRPVPPGPPEYEPVGPMIAPSLRAGQLDQGKLVPPPPSDDEPDAQQQQASAGAAAGASGGHAATVSSSSVRATGNLPPQGQSAAAGTIPVAPPVLTVSAAVQGDGRPAASGASTSAGKGAAVQQPAGGQGDLMAEIRGGKPLRKADPLAASVSSPGISATSGASSEEPSKPSASALQLGRANLKKPEVTPATGAARQPHAAVARPVAAGLATRATVQNVVPKSEGVLTGTGNKKDQLNETLKGQSPVEALNAHMNLRRDDVGEQGIVDFSDPEFD